MKKYQFIKIISITLTVMYLVAYGLCFLCDVTEFPISVGSVILGGFYGGPFVLALCWKECIVDFIKIRFAGEESSYKTERTKTIKTMWLIGVLGFIVFGMVLQDVHYVEAYREWIVKLIPSIILLGIILLCWMVLLIWYWHNFEKLIKEEDKKKKKTRMCVWIALIVLTLAGNGYAYDKGDDEWFKDLVERYNEEYGIDDTF